MNAPLDTGEILSLVVQVPAVPHQDLLHEVVEVKYRSIQLGRAHEVALRASMSARRQLPQMSLFPSEVG